MLVKTGNDYGFIDLPASKLELKDKLDLSGLEMHLDRAAEWTQIYNECWRQMRDYFYAPNMHGVDWSRIHDKYAALLPDVKYRYDLTYLIGEMIGELHIGHSYVGGGDVPAAPRSSDRTARGRTLPAIRRAAPTGSTRSSGVKIGRTARARR